MTIKWETPNLVPAKPSTDWAEKILARVAAGKWDYARDGHCPVTMARAALHLTPSGE